MKLETALRYCKEIHRRLKEVNGVIPTPTAQYEGMKVKKVWVFGSTIKGSQNPNDLDILFHWEPYGEKRSWQEVGYNKAYYRAHGIKATNCSSHEARKWITKGMKQVSRHDTESEATIFDLKVQIYPRFELQA